MIRPAPPSSRSPYNFEIVLLDHGLYFDLSDRLRVDYAHLWLSLLKSNATADRRKYAKLVGNIDDEHYNIFESAITGRVGMKGNGSLMVMDNQTREEQQLIRTTVVAQEGMIMDIFQILRSVPRRLLMILKVREDDFMVVICVSVEVQQERGLRAGLMTGQRSHPVSRRVIEHNPFPSSNLVNCCTVL